MTYKVDFSRSFRGAAWTLAGVCCVGLLSLGTTNCLPAPSDSNGGSGGGGNHPTGGNSGNPTGGSYGNPTGGSYSNPTGGSYSNPTGGSYGNPTGGAPRTGGTINNPTGGSYGNPTGGTIYNPTGGTIYNPTGGTSIVNPTGGTTTVTPTGGTTTTGPATCTTDLMTLRAMPDYNWIPVTPPSCSVQGALYAYSDGSTCTSPSPITANACTATGCCISGATVLDATSAKWGCGLGLDLSSGTGAAAAKSPYAGAAKGFKITIAGTVAAGQKIRIQYPSTATPPTGGTAPYKEVAGVGTYSVLFSDATCPTWATGGKCTPVSGVGAYSIQVQLSGGTTSTDAVGAFSNVCITSIVPL